MGWWGSRRCWGEHHQQPIAWWSGRLRRPSTQTLQTVPTTPSPDSPDAVDAAPDGVRLAELTEQLPLSRASVFEVVKALGIITSKGPGPGGRGRVAWVTSADADRIADACQRVDRGEMRIADLAGLQRRPSTQTALTARKPAPAPSAESGDPAPFLARLEAAERAIRSGLGLTTLEVSWIIGVKPGSSPLERGGIRATRTGWNCWRLSAVSGESGDDA